MRKLSPQKALKRLILISLFIALSVVLERLLGYNDKILSISFSFLPIAASGMMFGPWFGAVTAAFADLLGALLFPSGDVNLGFTLIAAISGWIYGYFLSKSDASKRTTLVLCQFLITFFCHLVFNTTLISLIIGKGFFALLPLRVVKNLLFYPIEVAALSKLVDYRPVFEKMLKG